MSKKPSSTLPPKRITVIVPGNIHKKFATNVKKNKSSIQKRVNELLLQDLAI